MVLLRFLRDAELTQGTIEEISNHRFLHFEYANVSNDNDTANCRKARATLSDNEFGHYPRFPTFGFPTSLSNTSPFARLRPLHARQRCVPRRRAEFLVEHHRDVLELIALHLLRIGDADAARSPRQAFANRGSIPNAAREDFSSRSRRVRAARPASVPAMGMGAASAVPLPSPCGWCSRSRALSGSGARCVRRPSCSSIL